MQASKHDPSADHWGNLSTLASRAFASRFQLDVAAATSRGEVSISDARNNVAARVICPAMQTFAAIRTMCSSVHPLSSDSAPAHVDIDSEGSSLVRMNCASLSCALLLILPVLQVGEKRRRLEKRKIAESDASCSTKEASTAIQESAQIVCASGAPLAHDAE